MDELRELVLTFEDPRYCNQCPYMTDKVDLMSKHLVCFALTTE